MMELFHVYLENHKSAPSEWVRIYRTYKGLVVEGGELGSRGAGRRPARRVTLDWSDADARGEVKRRKSRGWETWPDPYKDEIKHLIRQEKAKMEEEKKRAKEAEEAHERKMQRKSMGGRGRLRGL